MDVRAALLLPTVVRLVPEPRLLASQGEPGSFERVETVHPHCVRLFVSTRTASDARKHWRLGKPGQKLATVRPGFGHESSPYDLLQSFVVFDDEDSVSSLFANQRLECSPKRHLSRQYREQELPSQGEDRFWEGRTTKATAAVGVLPYAALILRFTTPFRFYAYDTPSIFHLIDRRLPASTEPNARCRRSTLSYHRAGEQRAACPPRSFSRWDV
jgi:hypothetical protein